MLSLVLLVTLPLLWTGTAGNQSRKIYDPRNASLYSTPAERSFIPNYTSSATYTDVHGEELGFNLSDKAAVNPYYMNRSHLSVISPRIGSTHKFNLRLPYSEYGDKFLNQEFHGNITILGNFNSSEDNSISQEGGKYEIITTALRPDGNFHSSQLRESMLGLRRSMVKLGLMGKCSTLPRKELERSAARIMDHVLLDGKIEKETVNAVTWKENHPVSEMLQIVFNGLPKRMKMCEVQSSNLDYHDSDLMNVIASLDPDLVEFLSYKIMPVKEYFGVDSEEIRERSLPILENICRDVLKVKEDELMLCLDDLSFLLKVIATGALERSSDAGRYKRSAEVLSEAVSEHVDTESAVVRRDGDGDGSYGGEKGYYSKDYKDSPSYVIIPETGGYDYYYPQLLKFLSALALGTYGFLGLLCFHTFLSAGALGGGPPGAKGNKGTTGIKGMLGDEGMKGVIGDVGPPGDKGLVGEKGSTGDIGSPGVTGGPGAQPLKGPRGMGGSPGPNGPPGLNGEKGNIGGPGSSGAPGPAGAKGDQGSRRRRSIERRHDYGIRGKLLDSHNLLNILNQMLEGDQQIVPSADLDLIQRINSLWKAYKNPPKCVKCKLFNFLKHLDFDNLEPYIIAGFSHILGTSESLQLLNDVREGKRRGIKMRCRRRKNTCDLEHLGDV